MVRQADYVYGVVPERGEYGFESQPANDDPSVLSRVQSLASSFQWYATASNDAEAIAVDRDHPPLVAHFVTDPRDPDGRRSLCMHIWITSETESLPSMIGELWPSSVALPISQDEFILSSAKETSGRIVVGPNESFTAVGFDSCWGTLATTHHPATRSAPRSTARTNAANSARSLNDPKSSSFMLKAFATLSAIALLATAGIAVTQYWEVERSQVEVDKLKRELKEAAKASGLITQQLVKESEANQNNTIEIATKTRELGQSRSDNDRLKIKVSDLETAQSSTPEGGDQRELVALRRFKAKVEEHFDDQTSWFQDLSDSVPEPPSNAGQIIDKAKKLFQGKSNNE